jgi:ATP phosphoribosyltransferase regulatory subunit HisZ
LIPAAAGACNRQIDLIGGTEAINGLKDQLQGERQLQLSDHQQRRLSASHSDDVTAAHFTLDLEALPFEKALNGKVEAGFD